MGHSVVVKISPFDSIKCTENVKFNLYTVAKRLSVCWSGARPRLVPGTDRGARAQKRCSMLNNH
jgi:hypothetical protein